MADQKLFYCPLKSNYLVTNKLAQDDTAAAGAASNTRWLIEQFHREAKHLTGLQAYQCRLARSQRNHTSLALRAWACLKRVVKVLSHYILADSCLPFTSLTGS